MGGGVLDEFGVERPDILCDGVALAEVAIEGGAAPEDRLGKLRANERCPDDLLVGFVLAR